MKRFLVLLSALNILIANFLLKAQIPPIPGSVPPASITTGSIFKVNVLTTIHSFSTICDGAQDVQLTHGYKIKIDKVDGNTVVFRVTQKPSGLGAGNFAEKHTLYCADLNDLSVRVDPSKVNGRVVPDISVITIPFKFKSDNIVQPGGSLGGFINARYIPASNSGLGISLGGFAGISSIPLNNTSFTTQNAPTDIKVTTGFGFGVGAIFTLRQAQFGVVAGRDLFNDGQKGSSSDWLSISIGFSFLQPSN